MPKYYVIRVEHRTAPSGFMYLQSVTMDEGEWKILYTVNQVEAMAWPHEALAREFKDRDDMPRGLGRVVLRKI